MKKPAIRITWRRGSSCIKEGLVSNEGRFFIYYDSDREWALMDRHELVSCSPKLKDAKEDAVRVIEKEIEKDTTPWG